MATEGSDEGRAFVYQGSAGGLPILPAWIVDGNQSFTGFGVSVGTAGDVNGDGFSDVIVGADFYSNGTPYEGAAFLYYGNDGPGRTTHPRQQRTDGVTPIPLLGKSDSDTQFRIRAILPSIYGRTRLQLEHEVKPLGALFDGLDTVTGAFVDIGDDGEIELDRLVSGLSPDTPYHWRVRANYHLVKTPFQRHGPWVQMPVNGWNEADLRTADAAAGIVTAEASGVPLLLEAPRPNPFGKLGGYWLHVGAERASAPRGLRRDGTSAEGARGRSAAGGSAGGHLGRPRRARDGAPRRRLLRSPRLRRACGDAEARPRAVRRRNASVAPEQGFGGGMMDAPHSISTTVTPRRVNHAWLLVAVLGAFLAPRHAGDRFHSDSRLPAGSARAVPECEEFHPPPTLDPAVRQIGADESWWQAVSSQLGRAEYAATPTSDGLQAPNRAHNLRTMFGARGIEVVPRTSKGAAPAWRFGWETSGFGRPGRMQEVSSSSPSSAGARVIYERDGLSEWYENTAKGLEQGFTIERRPAGEGPLRIAGGVPGGAARRARAEDGAIDFIDAHGACVIRYGELHVWDARGEEVPSRSEPRRGGARDSGRGRRCGVSAHRSIR